MRIVDWGKCFQNSLLLSDTKISLASPHPTVLTGIKRQSTTSPRNPVRIPQASRWNMINSIHFPTTPITSPSSTVSRESHPPPCVTSSSYLPCPGLKHSSYSAYSYLYCEGSPVHSQCPAPQCWLPARWSISSCECGPRQSLKKKKKTHAIFTFQWRGSQFNYSWLVYGPRGDWVVFLKSNITLQKTHVPPLSFSNTR